MMANCQWEAIDAGRCRSVCCGYVMSQPDPAKCFAACKHGSPRPLAARPMFLDCAYQLGAIGETTEHRCGGCPGGQLTTVCGCELFGKCAPMAWAPTPDKSIRRCVGCEKYEKTLPPAPGGE